MKYILLALAAAFVFAYLFLTEGTNYQVIGIALVLLSLPAIFFYRRSRKKQETVSVDHNRREFLLAGATLGLLAYFGEFARQRTSVEMIVDSLPKLKPVEIDLKIKPQATFSLQEPTQIAAMADGPFYTLGTPESRMVASEGTVGEPLIFQGRFVNQKGEPLEGVAIEIWHADGNGDYDNEGFNLRGHQFTNADGCFEFHTVKPLGYGERTLSFSGMVGFRAAHIHIKIKRNEQFLTTQLWFPDDPRNAEDLLLDDNSIMNQEIVDNTLFSRFDFVL